MELNDFIKNFANQFDETEPEVFVPGTAFRELDEWTSLTNLAIMDMIARKYGVKLAIADMRSVNTIAELFELVNSKR